MKQYKILIMIIGLLIMAFITTAYFTNQAKWVGIRKTGTSGDAVIPTVSTIFDPNYQSWIVEYDSDESYIYSMIVYDGKLYAGSGKDGIIYVYDGVEWSTDLDSPQEYVYSMEESNQKLYAAIDTKIYRYSKDNQSWSEVKDVKYYWDVQHINDMEDYNGTLYVIAGKRAGADTVTYAYFTSNSSWELVGDEISQFLVPMKTYKNLLYSGEQNIVFNGRINYWDGNSWEQVVNMGATADSKSMEVYKDHLYILSKQSGKIWQFDGTNITNIYTPTGISNVLTSTSDMVVYNEKLWVGMNDKVFSYNGDKWEKYNLPRGVSEIYALAVYMGKLFVGTYPNGLIYSYQTEPRREVILSDFDLPENKSIPVNITESILIQTNETHLPLPVNISNYAPKTYTCIISGNGTNQTDVNFNNLLNHMVITPASDSTTWKFRLMELNYNTTIYDGTGLEQTGRMGLTGVEIALIGQLNITIQNSNSSGDFKVYISYI